MTRVAKVDFHPDAAAEFDAATDWYRENSEQAAEKFSKRSRSGNRTDRSES